jgi:hypothetical protein
VNDDAYGGTVWAKGPPYRVEDVNFFFAYLNIFFTDKTHFYDATIPEVGVKDPVESL